MNIAPFTVAVDTREQLPYRFDDIRIERKKAFVLTVRTTLATGDYSIVGSESKICVERKSLTDLFGTLGNDRDRFRREIERMQSFERSLVIIEATWQTIAHPDRADPSWHSRVHPNSILGTINALAGEFPGTRWKAAGNRREAEKATFKFLLNWYNGNGLEENNVEGEAREVG